MSRIPQIILGALLLCSSPAAESGGGRAGQLDFLAGDWAISVAGGQTGHSHIAVEAPGAMIFELREIEGEGALPLWFEYSERTQRWSQSFPGPRGLREFALVSRPGAWPMIFAASVKLQDGAPARFELTLSKISNDESRRVLKLSRSGGPWIVAFDYSYRRAPSVRR